MNEQPKNINPYSLEDIERYLQGKLSPAEMHELEKAAVQDPFLADAIEGYQASDLTIVKQDIADLHNQLSSGPAKVIPAAAKQNSWWRVAAAILLLAGAGILGLKLFPGKNNTQEPANTANAVASQRDTSYLAATAAAKKETAIAVQKKEATTAAQKNVLAANNNRMLLSSKKSAANDNLASLDIKSLQPVAALSAKPYPANETMMAKDTILPGKIPARDIVAANTLATRSSGLPPQSNSSRENIYKAFDPALAAKKENINTVLANGRVTIGAGVLAGKGKKIKGDTINLDRSEMTFFSQAGYLKTTDSAIIPLSNPSFTVARNVIPGKRGIILIDTPVLTDQKKMYITFSESKPLAASTTTNFQLADAAAKKPATFNVGPQRLNTSLTKNDSIVLLPEVSVTGYGGISKKGVSGSIPSSDTRKELSRSAGAAPAYDTDRGTVSNLSGASFMVIPTGGWYDFTKYLADKIATKKDIGEHGSVEIKMNISESGKVSKVRILKSFNTQLNPILIKAIRKGPRWKSTDYLEKKDFIFKVDL